MKRNIPSVLNTVNFIKLKVLNNYQFQDSLKYLNSQYNDVALYPDISIPELKDKRF